MSWPKLTDDCLWFEWGVHPVSGHVDIGDRDGDVATGVPPALAEQIIKAHNDVINRISDRYVEWNKPVVQERITIVEAPGDLCGGTGNHNGASCPGCRACS